MSALYHCLARHAAAIIWNMHKDNAAAWRLHSAPNRALWRLQERCWRVVGALRARCLKAMLILYFEAVFAIPFEYNTSIHKMCYNIFTFIIASCQTKTNLI